MLRLLILLALASNTACNTVPFVDPNSSQNYPTVETTMLSTAKASIRQVILIAREEHWPSELVSPPDIGFASVFLRIENPQNENATLTIRSIKIQNASDGTLQAFSQEPAQEILLGPLENGEIVFHLKNRTGYSGQDQVKAVVTYQIGERISTIESEPVEVEQQLITGSTSPKMPR
ncbi:MAG: hypothetical protein QNJ54_00420 [Prochloraceae cyanobacterium]|nr:hypothetical protein [Prochloraceae cyanobacterium]